MSMDRQRDLSVSTVELADLVETNREDVWSISLDTSPTRPEHQIANPAYRIWVHEAVHHTLDGIAGHAKEDAARVARRVLAHVDGSPIRGRGMMIFAAPDLWQEYVLPIPLPNRLQYGRPDVIPMLWAMHEYKPYAIVAVYRDHARIILAYLGRAAVVDEEILELDTSDWKFKAGRTDTHARGAGIGVGRGAQTDGFQARINEHVRRFWKGVAKALSHELGDLRIDRVVLGGAEEAATAVRDLLPDQFRRRVIGIIPLPSYATLPEIQERTLPLALADREQEEAKLVADVLERTSSRGRGVDGCAAVLNALGSGEVRILVAGRDLDRDVWTCWRCGCIRTTAMTMCPACGGVLDQLPLRQVLPLMARRHGATLELVGSAASSRLEDSLGGLLRYQAFSETAPEPSGTL